MDQLTNQLQKLGDEIIKADGCKGAYSHPLDLIESWVSEKIDEIDEIEELKQELEWKKIDIQKEVKRNEELKKENEELKAFINELKINVVKLD